MLMERKKVMVVLLSAACGAVIGALATRFRGQLPSLPAFKPDDMLMAHRRFLLAAAAGWVLMSVYWDIAARSVSKAKSSESRGSRFFHVFLTNVALLLEIAPIRGLGRFLPVSVAIMSAGLVVEAVGLLIAIWSRRHLGRNWSGEITIKEEHALVQTGPYRWLRHPIYTGILVMYLGVVLVTGEWLAIAGLLVVLFAYWRKIRLEEKNLNVAFGEEYNAYRRDTWALVPGVF
jgi:protein-S-isoprenylcysteine O-methyltransferase Ste14